jgi:hypothetical protein
VRYAVEIRNDDYLDARYVSRSGGYKEYRRRSRHSPHLRMERLQKIRSGRLLFNSVLRLITRRPTG